jgi:hypothetical protein
MSVLSDIIRNRMTLSDGMCESGRLYTGVTCGGRRERPEHGGIVAISSQDHYVTFVGARATRTSQQSHLGISTFSGTGHPAERERLEEAGVKRPSRLPWEGTNTWRPARATPARSARDEHYLSTTASFQVDLFDTLHLADCGDVSIIRNAKRTFERAERCITEIYEAGLPIVLGGDDSSRSPSPARCASSSMADGLHQTGLPHGHGRGRGGRGLTTRAP